jgi:hypothetical protein
MGDLWSIGLKDRNHYPAMKKLIILTVGCLALIQTISAQAPSYRLTDSEANETLGMIKDLRLCQPSWAYRSVAIERMLREANYFSAQLKLSLPHPIQPSDLCAIRVFDPWYSTIRETNAPYLPATVFKTHIYDASIPRDQRARALKISASGIVATTNFFFSFGKGVLRAFYRQNEEGLEYHPPLSKPVIINEAEAHQLATQYLAAVSVDVSALEKQFKPKIWRYHYFTGTSNEVVAHFFNVQWGAGDSPPVTVAIDGTTKELLGFHLYDASFSNRPLLIITNAIELNNIPDPPMKHLERPLPTQTTNSKSAMPPIDGHETKP